MDEKLKVDIQKLCNLAEEVCDNSDWPTDDTDDLYVLVAEIRDGLAYL